MKDSKGQAIDGKFKVSLKVNNKLKGKAVKKLKNVNMSFLSLSKGVGTVKLTKKQAKGFKNALINLLLYLKVLVFTILI